jgi:hypothetical protein
MQAVINRNRINDASRYTAGIRCCFSAIGDKKMNAIQRLNKTISKLNPFDKSDRELLRLYLKQRRKLEANQSRKVQA